MLWYSYMSETEKEKYVDKLLEKIEAGKALDEIEYEVLEQYAKRVCLGSYVPCEICRNLHDDEGLMTYKGKEVYVCLDCLEASEEERNQREKQ